ncbi:MAG: lipocalin-like domain-containing protein [Litoreibacter sp.]|nr:lipocalin-like domain-containing protein [Litoreibacter sp.]
MMETTPLEGTWSLLAWYNETQDGQRFYPLGPDATGYISYSRDGFVFVHLMARDRLLYTVADPFAGTAEEDAAAMKSQITYAGPYEYKGDHVIHRVTQASCPNWVGTEQVRQVAFKGGRLRLSAAGTFMHGREITAYVDWERPKP